MQATEARSTGQQHVGRLGDGTCAPSRHRILIVEDDPGMRALLREAMHDAGLQVAEARDGRTALDAFLELRPDLILLDARLPQLDGFETCCQLRELPGGVALAAEPAALRVARASGARHCVLHCALGRVGGMLSGTQRERD